MRLQALKLLAIIIVSLFIASAGSGCNEPQEPSNVSGISREDAIRIATERVEADGKVSLDEYAGVTVEEEEDYWHVYWYLPPEMLGGGPNVFVDKSSGAITQIYYQQ